MLVFYFIRVLHTGHISKILKLVNSKDGYEKISVEKMLKSRKKMPMPQILSGKDWSYTLSI